MADTTTGQRIGDILDSIDFTEPEKRNLDTGDDIFDVPPRGETSALGIIQDLLTAERGVVYVQRDGVFRYEERATRARKTSAGTITNAVVRTDPGWELDSLKNRVSVQRTNPVTGANIGRAQIAQNDASVAAYGVSDATEITTGYLSPQTDATALSLAQYIVNIRQGFRKPVDVELHGNDVATSRIQLERELQDRVTLSTDTAAGDWHIEKIEHRIRPGSFVTTFSLSDRGTEAFVIDTDTFDNTTNLITY
ncbi:MAG: hypothetical protein RLZ48_759 [Actinomycetota bacterium]